MTDYDNTNRGVLFKNDKKETDNHPDMTGTLNINGVDHYISAWTKVSKNGNKFLSLSLGKPKTEKSTAKSASLPVEGFDDDLPF